MNGSNIVGGIDFIITLDINAFPAINAWTRQKLKTSKEKQKPINNLVSTVVKGKFPRLFVCQVFGNGVAKV